MGSLRCEEEGCRRKSVFAVLTPSGRHKIRYCRPCLKRCSEDAKRVAEAMNQAIAEIGDSATKALAKVIEECRNERPKRG